MLRPGFLAVLALAPFLSGCVAAAAAAGVVGVGVVQYNRNDVEADFPSDLADTWKGAFEGLARLGIQPAESELGPSEGRIEHLDLVVIVERHPEGFSRVRVRVGTFCTADHRRRALIVLQEIGKALERQDELRAWAEKGQSPQSSTPPTKPGSGGGTAPPSDLKPQPKRQP